MSRIFRDTSLFVHLIEDRGERAGQVAALRRWMIERVARGFAEIRRGRSVRLVRLSDAIVLSSLRPAAAEA